MKSSFKSYDMLYTGTTNTLKCRSVPRISLRQSNKDGGQFFISLYTGKYTHRDTWVELPIDDNIVKWVDDLAKIGKHPNFDKYPMFQWAPVISIMDNMTENEDEESNE